MTGISHDRSFPPFAGRRRRPCGISSPGTHVPTTRALEIGPGTGFYTTMLASRVRHVTAIEDSAGMAELLTRRLAREGVENVSVVNDDFRVYGAEDDFDVVMAIGVLDYIPEPVEFVSRMCALAERAVLFTVPQRGLWGTCFVASNRLRGISVFCYREATVTEWAPGWRGAVKEAGLKTPLTRGLTLVAALEPETNPRKGNWLSGGYRAVSNPESRIPNPEIMWKRLLDKAYFALFREYPQLKALTLVTLAAQLAAGLISFYALPKFLFENWGLTGEQVGLVGSTFLVSETLCKIPLGRISDRVGRRPLITLSTLCICLNPLFIIHLPQTFWKLVFPIRAVDGAGAAASGHRSTRPWATSRTGARGRPRWA